ncbi:IS30 family transposase [Rhodococcus sp. ACT016]|uniref:IS30 family transposase n=1 Tax=Rhodococcus sp. ACT016 TaxID=3134808 RepID=UPI003D281D7A
MIGRNPQLRRFIQTHSDKRWSPEQICQALQTAFPERPEMHVVRETMYQALYVQGRGELRHELAKALRTGRGRRQPRRQAQQRQPRFATPMVMISDRPAEVEDRAVPGHREGDLIKGKDGASAIGTLVERATRYVILVHLPHGRSADLMRDALGETVTTSAPQNYSVANLDQGSEMSAHHSFTIATDIPVYVCHPASPWQRGSNEKTNNPLRQYFPKGIDLSVHSRKHLDTVAAELNGRHNRWLSRETVRPSHRSRLRPASVVRRYRTRRSEGTRARSPTASNPPYAQPRPQR